jgi:glutathione synthase/RimK-type ligase-like ATP-grasp enzyme
VSKVIFISAHDDAHLAFVRKHFDANDEIIRIDPFDILEGKTLDYEFMEGQMRVYYQGKPLEGISGVWYRRPSSYEAANMPVVDEEKEYAHSAMNRHILDFGSLFEDALWMSDVTAIRRASSKPLQQIMAVKLGFAVPDTLYATDPKRAEDFVKKKGLAIAKTSATIFPPQKLAFAKVVRSEDAIDYTGVGVDPFIFQTLIDPEKELRVTVVGGEVFAAEVMGGEEDKNAEFRDWRYGHVVQNFAAKAYTLPAEVSARCVALVKALNLVFGAIDIILDKQGIYWFLEINPNGQWAFVEQETGQPIGKAIAAMLKKGKA